MSTAILLLIGAVLGAIVDRLWTPLQRVTLTPLWNLIWKKFWNTPKRIARKEAARSEAYYAPQNERVRRLHRALLGRQYSYREFDGSRTAWHVVDIRAGFFPSVTIERIGTTERRVLTFAELDPQYCLLVPGAYAFPQDLPECRYEHVPLPSDWPVPAYPPAGEPVQLSLEVHSPVGLLTYAISGRSNGQPGLVVDGNLQDFQLDGKKVPHEDAKKWLVRLGLLDLHACGVNGWKPEADYCQHAEPTDLRSAYPKTVASPANSSPM